MFSCLLNDGRSRHVQGLAEVAFTNPTMGRDLERQHSRISRYCSEKISRHQTCSHHNGFAPGGFRPCTSGTILARWLPFWCRCFPALPGSIALGTIQTAIGDHIHSSVARDHGLIGHGCFIHLRIDTKERRVFLPLSARINCFNFKRNGMSRPFMGLPGGIW